MLDIVVFGATGFVGRLVASYLLAHAPPGVTIGVAGRSKAKLEALGLDCPLIVADAGEPEKVAASGRVVATTVGPYRRYGLGLVDACIARGTHYCDLTGEVLFVHETIKRHEQAERAGVRIVHSAGFDSIPSALGTFLLHDAAGELGDTTLITKALRGGFSGGTLASLKGQLDEMKADKSVRKVIANPHALGGTDTASDLRTVKRDSQLGWIGPFVMASYNTRIVRRSSELLGYGPDFRYREVSGYPNPVLALGTTAALGALAGGLALPPTRAVLDKVLPGPGDGPSEKARERGYFRLEVHGAGHKATVAAKGDPGYKATALMMGETALALALEQLPERFGVLTPASGLGMPLVERRRAAGMTLSVTAV
jgi:short subunit dehydrogenase-like uncharacterized protein